ncbi:MAG: hypothetical protein JO261_08840 [Alphaproteobacteria bacterium]|nr:hypothetical protein [Alphaproteobacteria bacterium]MBV9693794.1 hypothetical protein [Alphaproteobacteria bacterium]
MEIASDIRGVISVGIAGALSPDLKIGDAVVAERVVTANDIFETDAGWTARLAARVPDAMLGAVLGRGEIAGSAEVKALLHQSTKAVSVDLESHVAARAAAARNLPFAALRIISDIAEQELPRAALVAMKPDGSISLGRVLMSVMSKPAQIPALIRTARDSEKAFAALLRCVEALGPGLGCPYLG